MGEIFGKITSYGYSDDPYGDSLTSAGLASKGRIVPNYSVAFSPDVERAAKSKGITIGDEVRIIFADGSSTVRLFNDRTMQDAQAIKKFGQPLTGRVDLHKTGKGPSPLDGKKVVDIQPVDGGKNALARYSGKQEAPASIPVVEPPLPTKDDEPDVTPMVALASNTLIPEVADPQPGRQIFTPSFPQTSNTSKGVSVASAAPNELDKTPSPRYITPSHNPTDPLKKPEGVADWGQMRSLFGSTNGSTGGAAMAVEDENAKRAQREAEKRTKESMRIIAALTPGYQPSGQWRDRLDAALRLMPRMA